MPRKRAAAAKQATDRPISLLTFASITNAKISPTIPPMTHQNPKMPPMVAAATMPPFLQLLRSSHLPSRWREMSTIPAIVQASHSADATLIPTTNEVEGISPSAYESPSDSASTANTPTMMRKNATRRFLRMTLFTSRTQPSCGSGGFCGFAGAGSGSEGSSAKNAASAAAFFSSCAASYARAASRSGPARAGSRFARKKRSTGAAAQMPARIENTMTSAGNAPAESPSPDACPHRMQPSRKYTNSHSPARASSAVS